MMQEFLITNNPAVHKEYSGRTEIEYLEDKRLIDVMYFARDRIHEGHKLLTHPLSGSVKPGQTPYKTIVLSKEKGELDIESVRLIEDSIMIALVQIGSMRREPQWPEKVLNDFQLIDLGLIGTRR